MRYLKIKGSKPVAIEKSYFTVGLGNGYDLSLPSAESKIIFSVMNEQESYSLIPGEEKIYVNGKSISKSQVLEALDRIEWKNHTAIFVDELEGSKESSPQTNPLSILRGLASSLDSERDLGTTLRRALQAIVDFAGAEQGYLVSDMGTESEWRLLASVGNEEVNPGAKRKELVSSTILGEAIKSRKPVYVESMIGHQWERQASIMDARIFSLACTPLLMGDRVFGALYLYTRTPGRSIRKESLDDLNVIATQVALLLSSQNELRKVKRENHRLKTSTPTIAKNLIFDRESQSSPMHLIESRIGKLGGSDLSILIRGETGTGKELIAREIHLNSPRGKGPFVAINVAAIPPSLLESTLFGYVKGAFTGAHKDHPGKFLQANGGTIFLDEIGDLPLDLQAKLLRVLQEKEVEAVGAERTTSIDFRVLAATHQDLEALVSQQKFRQDLYFRLNGATIQVPALKERPSDIVVLAEHFLTQSAPHLSFSEEAKARLLKHDWPGNVRELQQVIARAAALTDGPDIKPEDLELVVSMPRSPSLGNELVSLEDFASLKDAQLAFTKEFVKRTLDKFGGNRSKVASHLGISERTLYRLLAGDITGRDL